MGHSVAVRLRRSARMPLQVEEQGRYTVSGEVPLRVPVRCRLSTPREISAQRSFDAVCRYVDGAVTQLVVYVRRTVKCRYRVDDGEVPHRKSWNNHVGQPKVRGVGRRISQDGSVMGLKRQRVL